MKMTIAQGIAFNKIKALNKQRAELVGQFNRIAKSYRDVSGMYVRGTHSGADYVLGRIEKIDAQIAEWRKQA
jgi:hypothetical protein